MDYPRYLSNLIESYKSYPGVGLKSATRMALQTLDMPQETIDNLIKALSDLQANVQYCLICHNLSDEDTCMICSNEQRDHSIICVVSNYKDIYAIEKMQDFQGVYHVLNGDIAINKGITPDKLNITSLINRIDHNTKEVIIATNPTIEGETSALYISKLLAHKQIEVTRIGHGLPIGANIDYIDELTMLKAFENRNKIK
ncbi:MAG: recombination mediator RecR [Bacilli bacterium]